MKYQRLRGTQDVLADQATGFAWIESMARTVFGRFGFEEIRTPILEAKEVFTRALGTETDVVQKEMYEFLDRSKEWVAMRPEGTAGVVRAYLENSLDKNVGHAKLFYMGPMFRSERPQAGRQRQFHQVGVELLGTDSPFSDVEAIHALCVFLKAVGVSGFKLRLNNLGTFAERQEYRKELASYFAPHEAALCEDCKNRYQKNVFRLLDCKVDHCRKIAESAPTIEKYLTLESLQHFAKVEQGLRACGVEFSKDLRMVRGLDYYTRTVFEVSHSDLGAQDALGAGGRYDQLIETFGGSPAGAVGFAVGVERLCLCLPKDVSPMAAKASFFVVTLGEQAFMKGLELLSVLRENELPVSMDFSAKSMKSQMRSADKHRAKFVLILGDTELEKKVILLKNMQTGTQTEVALDQLSATLQSL